MLLNDQPRSMVEQERDSLSALKRDSDELV
jgi:hypothetical protein